MLYQKVVRRIKAETFKWKEASCSHHFVKVSVAFPISVTSQNQKVWVALEHFSSSLSLNLHGLDHVGCQPAQAYLGDI